MTTPASPKAPRKSRRAAAMQRPGFYDRTYTADELRRLNTRPKIEAEQDLLRTKVLRLARLTPLKKINDKELNTLLKLIRVVAVIDALERTLVTARKGGVLADPLLESLAAMDPDDL